MCKKKIYIITMSDSVTQGKYPDESGPIIESFMNKYAELNTSNIEISKEVLPDEGEKLKTLLLDKKMDEMNIIFITGGTGIGPRDITPEIVSSISDKLIPGIPEFIRMKYGSQNPYALLSRSVVAIKNKTLIFSIPGSKKAVTEYLEEIIKLLPHMLEMIEGKGH